MKRFTKWQTRLLARFGPRHEIQREELLALLEPGITDKEAYQLFDLLEQEYGIPAGFFRPDDSLEALLRPVKTTNPLQWPGYQMRASDSEAELNYQLGKKLSQHGTLPAWSRGSVRTFGDLARAWSGGLPADGGKA